MPYKPFCFAARDPQRGFSRSALGLGEGDAIRPFASEKTIKYLIIENALHALRMRLPCLCPVKQKRALLKSNPPRDNWIEGDEITVSTWEAQTSPKPNLERDYFRAEYALKTSTVGARAPAQSVRKNQKPPLASVRVFEAIPPRPEWAKVVPWASETNAAAGKSFADPRGD